MQHCHQLQYPVKLRGRPAPLTRQTASPRPCRRWHRGRRRSTGLRRHADWLSRAACRAGESSCSSSLQADRWPARDQSCPSRAGHRPVRSDARAVRSDSRTVRSDARTVRSDARTVRSDARTVRSDARTDGPNVFKYYSPHLKYIKIITETFAEGELFFKAQRTILLVEEWY